MTIDHPSPWLQDGVRLIDTPGIGSVYQHNTDVAQRYLPQADAVLFIASVDQPLGSAELDFLSSIRQHADKIFCLLNKTDYLDADELTESLQFATGQLHSTLNATTPLFAVSAKLALQGKRQDLPEAITRSGFPEFERALAEFMIRDKDVTWLRSIARRLLRTLSQLRFTLQLEARLLTAPQEQIDRSLAAFRAKRLEVQQAASDHQVLLEADAQALLKNDIEPALRAFKEQLQSQLTSAVQDWYSHFTASSSGALQEALEARLVREIRAAYDAWIATQDARLRTAFESLCGRAWNQLQEAVDELMRYSSELFAIDFSPVRSSAEWTLESDFYYKFWHEPPSLRILANSAILALPKAIAGRMIIKRAQVRAQELIEAQSGRIRHDFEERMKASVRAARRQIASNADSILERLETALSRGLGARHQSEALARTRGHDLEHFIQTAAAIEQRVTALVP